jgi:Single Cache domain 2
MNPRTTIALSVAALLCIGTAPSTLAQQGQSGTAQEARAMLDKAVAAVKADRDIALEMFNKGEGGFRDRDLYPFCFRIADGKAVATPVYVPAGTDARTLKDPTGKAYGQELYAAAQKPEGQITEVSYQAPKPGTTAPVFAKVSFMTKVGDLGCGVGYYK